MKQIRADGDDGLAMDKTFLFQPFKKTQQQPISAVIKVDQLLGQTGMHVIEQFVAKKWFKEQGHKHCLLMRLHHIIAVSQQERQHPKKNKHVMYQLF